MLAQENKITILKQDNSQLWQEIHRLKGLRLPLEISFLIVNSSWDDRQALNNFSLVCKGWMGITQEILFARTSLDAIFRPVELELGVIHGLEDVGDSRTRLGCHRPSHTTSYETRYSRTRSMGVGMPALAAFVSKLTNFTTLACGEIYANITNLVLADCGRFPPNVLKWFTDLHPGVIESLSPFDLPDHLPASHPMEFRNFVDRFDRGVTL
ncbi:hypothetical protein B0H14DRAFT_3172034 [Mycena olivaceomarginata]|nr:hypothetical protein B0H14DRAFT_3172034 [Mycena olivaceomarginata]